MPQKSVFTAPFRKPKHRSFKTKYPVSNISAIFGKKKQS